MDTMIRPERQTTAEELVEKRRLQNREAQKRRRAKLRNAAEQEPEDDLPRSGKSAAISLDTGRASTDIGGVGVTDNWYGSNSSSSSSSGSDNRKRTSADRHLSNVFDDIFGSTAFNFPASDAGSLFSSTSSSSSSPSGSKSKASNSSPSSSGHSSSSSPIEELDQASGAALTGEGTASSYEQTTWSTSATPAFEFSGNPFRPKDRVNLRCEVIQKYSANKSINDAKHLLEHLSHANEYGSHDPSFISPSSPTPGLSDLHMFFSAQPQLFENFVASLRMAEILSSKAPASVRIEMFKSILESFKVQAARYLSLSSPSPFHGLQLPSQHLFQAVLTNASRMGYAFQDLENFNAVSRIGESFLGITSPLQLNMPSDKLAITVIPKVKWDTIPETMYPTALQLVEEHHPFIDISFVWPTVRDKVLTLLKNGLDEDAICTDMMMGGLLPGAEPSFMVWGNDTMDVDSWEVSERFATKWWFLFEPEIIKRTNWWRKQRGLHPIRIDFSRDAAQSAPWSTRKRR